MVLVDRLLRIQIYLRRRKVKDQEEDALDLSYVLSYQILV